MTEVGDLRQRILWGEISGQLQSFVVLYDRIVESTKGKGFTVNVTHFESISSLKLLYDCLCSQQYLPVECSLKLCNKLECNEIIDKEVLSIVLKNSLPYSAHRQTTINYICDLLMRGCHDINSSNIIVKFCVSNVNYTESILSWFFKRLGKCPEFSILHKLGICLFLSPNIPLDHRICIAVQLKANVKEPNSIVKSAFCTVLSLTKNMDIELFLERTYFSAVDQDIFCLCLRESDTPHNLIQYIASNFALSLDNCLMLAACIGLCPIEHQTKLLSIVLTSLTNDASSSSVCHAVILPSVLHFYGNLGSMKSLGVDTDQINKLLVQCIQKLTQGLGDHISTTETDQLKSIEAIMYSLKIKNETAFSAWLRYATKYSWTCEMQQLDKIMIASYFLSFVSLSQDLDLLKHSLKCICQMVEHDSTLSSFVLPTVMHRFSKEKDSGCRDMLLSTFPNLATHRFCIPPILKFLTAMAKSKLAQKTLPVLGDLWLKQERIFPQIKDLLFIDSKDTQNIQMVKMGVIRTICKTSDTDPEDFWPMLMDVVMQRNAECDGCIVHESVLAIGDMCSSQVLQYSKIWSQIWSRLKGDPRPPVLDALCQFLSVAGSVSDLSESVKYDIIGHLWSFVTHAHFQVANSAFNALTSFDPQSYVLQMLPQMAKQNLKVPANLIRTPADAAKNAEDVLDYIPPIAYINMAKGLDIQVRSTGYKAFLIHVLKKEVDSLGRAAYHPAPSKIKSSASKFDVDLSQFCELMGNMYMKNDNKSTNNSLAVGVLQYYDPPMELSPSGEVSRRAIFSHGRKYLDVLKKLLNDIPVDVSDWYKSLVIVKCWPNFVNRTFCALLHSRVSELELAPSKSEEQKKRINNACFWARDQVVEILKQCSRYSSIAHANSLIALASLAVSLKQFWSDNETTFSTKQIADCTNWLVAVVETLLHYSACSIAIKGQPIITNLTKPGTQVSCLASLGAAFLLPEIKSVYEEFLGDIDKDFARYLVSSLSSSDVLVSFYSPMSLAIFMDKFYRNDGTFYSTFIKDLLNATMENVSIGKACACVQLAKCTNLPTTGPYTCEMIVETLIKACNTCKSNQLLKESLFFSILQCLKCLLSKRTQSLNHQLVEDVGNLLKSDSSGSLNSVLYGVLCKEESNKILVEAVNKLISQEGLPMRLADSVDLLSSACLLKLDECTKEVQGWIKVLSKFGITILKEQSDNVFLLNSLCLNLPELQLSLIDANENADASGNSPSDYDYLSNKLLLRHAVHGIKTLQDNSDISGLYVEMLGSVTKLLPPLDWAKLLQNYFQENDVLSPSIVSIACYQDNCALINQILKQNSIVRLDEESMNVVLETLPSWSTKIDPSILINFIEYVWKTKPSNPVLIATIVKLTQDVNLPSSHTKKIFDTVFDWVTSLQLLTYSHFTQKFSLDLLHILKEIEWNNELERRLLDTLQDKPVTRLFVLMCISKGFEAVSLKNLVANITSCSRNRCSCYFIMLHGHTLLSRSPHIEVKRVLELINLSNIAVDDIDQQSVYLNLMCSMVNASVHTGFPLPILDQFSCDDEFVENLLLDALYARTLIGLKTIVKKGIWGNSTERILVWMHKLLKVFQTCKLESFILDCIVAMKGIEKFDEINESHNLHQVLCDKLLSSC